VLTKYEEYAIIKPSKGKQKERNKMITPFYYLIYVTMLVCAGLYGLHRVEVREAKKRKWQRKIEARKKLWK